MEDKRTAEIRRNAEAEALKMLETAEQNLHHVIEEAGKNANQEASKAFKEIEQKVFRIIQETMKIAETDAGRIVAQAEDKAQQIIEEAEKKAEAMQKAILEMESEGGRRKAAHRLRVELVIIPPVDFVQLEKLRVSLHQLANLRILSMWGNSDGGTSIFALTERPDSLIPDLRSIDVVDEAMEIDGEMLDSDLVNHSAKRNFPLRPSKRSDEQRILVLLKRVA
jgi:vacuolar-type H+-ATPase subunit H